jgi:hypothetical protein
MWYLGAPNGIPWPKRGAERQLVTEKRAPNSISPDVFLIW